MATAQKHFAEITIPFGDGEQTFRLDYKLASAWEKENGSLMANFRYMLSSKSLTLSDARSIIHMGLVGAGQTPSAATAVVTKWVEDRPLGESLPTVLAILEAFLFGADGSPAKVAAQLKLATDGIAALNEDEIKETGLPPEMIQIARDMADMMKRLGEAA